MQKVLQAITDKQARSAPLPRETEEDWLNYSDLHLAALSRPVPLTSRDPDRGYPPVRQTVVSSQTAAPVTADARNASIGYVPPTDSFRARQPDVYHDHPQHEDKHYLLKPRQHVLQEPAYQPEATPTSDAALFSLH